VRRVLVEAGKASLLSSLVADAQLLAPLIALGTSSGCTRLDSDGIARNVSIFCAKTQC
jgi:hypothetical protein